METDIENNINEDEETNQHEPMDPIATILFLVFGGALGYLLIASGFGLFPFIVVGEINSLLPIWEAVITFIALLIIMFTGLIGGRIKMLYSIYLVGIVTLVAVFAVTFYAMLAVSQLIGPLPP